MRPMLIMLVILPAAVSAQVTGPILARTDTGRVVRVLTVDGHRREGKVMSIAATSFIIDSSAGAIDARAVDSLWIRGNKSGKGALIGAAIIGIPVTLGAFNACHDRPTGERLWSCGTATGISAVGILVGAGLGAMIGSFSPRWNIVYARARSGTNIGLNFSR
jgi:hypothetical protein